MMNKETVKTVRTIVHHIGSLAACERWTYPQIKADLNWWEQGFEVAL